MEDLRIDGGCKTWDAQPPAAIFTESRHDNWSNYMKSAYL